MNTTQTLNTTKTQAQTKATASNEISKVGVTALGISATIIGCWAIACLFSATLSSGGPAGLISNLMQAITG